MHPSKLSRHRWDRPPYFVQCVFSNVVRWLQLDQNVLHATVISARWIAGWMVGLPPTYPPSLRRRSASNWHAATTLGAPLLLRIARMPDMWKSK